jgi:hypothetical protein
MPLTTQAWSAIRRVRWSDLRSLRFRTNPVPTSSSSRRRPGAEFAWGLSVPSISNRDSTPTSAVLSDPADFAVGSPITKDAPSPRVGTSITCVDTRRCARSGSWSIGRGASISGPQYSIAVARRLFHSEDLALPIADAALTCSGFRTDLTCRAFDFNSGVPHPNQKPHRAPRWRVGSPPNKTMQPIPIDTGYNLAASAHASELTVGRIGAVERSNCPGGSVYA